MERSADCALYLLSGDWLVPQRVRRRGTGEIKVTLLQVDAVREGQGHAGSTPATSTISAVVSFWVRRLFCGLACRSYRS